MRRKPRIQTPVCLTPESKDLGSCWGQLLAPLILTAVVEHRLWAKCFQFFSKVDSFIRPRP